jgi:alkylhydroperoxidase family enzyme
VLKVNKTKFFLSMIVYLLASVQTFSQTEYSQISRLPPLQAPLDESTQKLLDATRSKGGQIINLHLTYAHAPSIGNANLAMAYALRFQSKSPRQLREIAIIRTAQILDAKYELNQHLSLGVACGLTSAQIDEMPTWRAHPDHFNSHQRAVLAYADAIGYNKGEVDDETYKAMSSLFDPQEIVELTMAIGAYTSTAYFTKALRTQIEVDGRSAAPGKC